MIRNETVYQEVSARLAEERSRLDDYRSRLKEAGLSEEEIKRVTDPMKSFQLQAQEEVESYERLKRGDVEEFDNLRAGDIGGRIMVLLSSSSSEFWFELRRDSFFPSIRDGSVFLRHCPSD